MDNKDDLFSADLFGEEEIVTQPAQEAVAESVEEFVEETVEATPAAIEEEPAPQEPIEEVVSEEPAKPRLEEQPVQTGDDGERLTLAHFASHAYLEYAMSVVKGRALPDICDGQKPVQRRILYAMHEMGLGPDAKPVKSARVVGNVLGKYHPHGDSAAYEAMVRMAQDFNMRYPLVLGQGNFGSRDGDGAAAMRYTEAHLTKISRLLLEEIKEGTVDFIPNYDGAFKEPTELPARLPFGLLNGSSGIAVGMATEIPSHNLKEVAAACMMLLDNPESTLDDILTVLPAPDFPMGGQIISKPSEIRDAYATGRGSLKVRARYEFEDLARGHWRLIVKELPPNTSAQKVLNEIEEITNPKVRPGKKALSAEQQQTKAAMLAILDGVRDESGKEEATRLVFEPKSKNQNRQDFVNALLAQTSMEGNVSMNLVMVGLDGKPRQKTLLQILTEWVQFRIATVRRRTQFRLDKACDRIHILEGRRLVYLNLDDVIAIIREADDPKAALMAKYPLSERQTDDILEIRLRQLARLEGIKIDAELAQLNKTRESLERLLNSEKLLVKLVSKEIAADAQEFGDDRRTLVEEASKAELTQTVVDEPVTVIISQKGYIRARTGHGHDASIMSYKMGDAYASSYECRTTDNLVAISSTGRVYTIAVADLPSARGDGLPINSFIELEKGTQLVAFCVAKPDAVVLFSSTEGMGFVCHFKDLIARLRAGKAFMKLSEHAKILPPLVVRAGEDKLACLSQEGRLLIFDLSEVRVLAGGGMGVKLMDLNLGEKLIVAKPITSAGVMVMGEGRGGKIREYAVKRAHYDNHVGRRARKGKQLDIRWKATKLVDLPPKNPSEPEEPVEPMTENGELSLI